MKGRTVALAVLVACLALAVIRGHQSRQHLAEVVIALADALARREADIDEALALVDSHDLTTAQDALLFLLDPHYVVTDPTSEGDPA